jgi:hypothetical protein
MSITLKHHQDTVDPTSKYSLPMPRGSEAMLIDHSSCLIADQHDASSQIA